MSREDLPTLSCIDTTPALGLLKYVDDADFPERAAFARELLKRTVADLRSTADFLEREIRGRTGKAR